MKKIKNFFKRNPKVIDLSPDFRGIDPEKFRKALSKIDLEKEYLKLSRGTTKTNLV